MSLKARLSLLIIGLVAASVLGLTVLQFNSLVSAWLQHAAERSATTAQVIKKYVQERTGSIPLPSPTPPLAEIQKIWTRQLEQDPELRDMMSTALAQTRSIVEIAIANENGRIIASTNPANIGSLMRSLQTLKHLQDLGPISRLQGITGGRIDYESRVGLGLPGQVRPMFTIQVLTSSALLRDAILPEMWRTLPLSVAALFIAVFLAWWAARVALRPLERLGQTIDRIASGQADPEPPSKDTPAAEFVAVEQKLRILGEQFRGAQQSSSQLRGSVEQILERLEDVIFLADAAGRVVMCGQPAERLLGLPRAQILSRPLAELFPIGTALGDTIQTAVAERRRLEDKPFTWGNQEDPTPVLLSLDYLPSGGTVLRLRDLRGRQMLESQLNLAQRLSAINRLTGGVAHEIKNPLNSIAIRLELLKNRVLPEVPAAEPELNVIAQEITRLDRVVRTFLDFTRPVELNTVELDLVALTDNVLTLVRPEAELAGIKIEFTPRIAPVRVLGDADLLKQAILNIVRNGIEAMPGGGQLTLSLIQGPREAVLTVADNGPGIPVEERDKVFQLYYSTKGGGSGIGLAMTYRAIQLHGGSIEVDGAPGGGALLRLRLPAVSAHRLAGGTA
jgi:signal transduction histidine kinase/HAMP domain-containing protein